MDRYPRLNRSKVIERLRVLAAKHGHVSHDLLLAHDRVLLRSIPLHFAGLAAARDAAHVPAPPYTKPAKKTGPKPGHATGRRPRIWSRERVLRELHRRARAGERTALGDLIRAGLGSLVHAARIYAGGLRHARVLAGIDAPTRRKSKPRWTRERIVRAIQVRQRNGQSLSMSRAPARLVTAGRWHFGNWSAALAAAGIDPAVVRLPPGHKYTKEEIIARLRRAARVGSDLRSLSLTKVLKMEAVRREFGSLRVALYAAGLGPQLEQRKHGLQKWSRARMIEVLQQRAARGVYTFTPGLHRVAQLYFGGAEHAHAAAGVPSPADMRRQTHSQANDAAREQMTPRRARSVAAR